MFSSLAVMSIAIVNSTYASEMMSTWEVSTWATNNTVEAISTKASASIIWMDYLDESTINVKLTWVTSVDAMASELKVLQNLKATTTKDATNSSKILLSIPSSLVSGATYSAVSITPSLEANMDFVYNGEKEILNTMTWWTNYISKVVVIDDKTLELNFASDVSIEKVEYQFLKEVWVSEKMFNVDTLSIKTREPLLSNSDYALISSLKDNMWTDIELDIDSSMKDFTTPEFTIPAAEVREVPQVTTTTETTSTWVTWTWDTIEEVATEVKETPDTWAETLVIMILAVILWVWVFYARNRKKA